MVSSTRSPRKWDSPMLLASPSNSTPSARFAVDTASGLKTRVWVEEVIGRRLPEGDFAAGFKDGVGLCELLNVFKPGTIPKIETSKSPFHQMANISCFLKAVRALGVREQVLFETLDLFNENRLSQVVRCLFSLSELVRTTMPSYPGPYLAAPEKPGVDPAVLHLVDLAKGNVVLAPGWGGPVTPGAVSTASTGGGGGNNGVAVGAAGPALALPRHAAAAHGSGCLSPAAHEAGKLTYGIYEGGGVATKPLATSPIVGGWGGGGGQRRAAAAAAAAADLREEGRGGEEDSAAATADDVLEEQLRSGGEQDRAAGGGEDEAAAVATGVEVAAVEYAESSLPVNTPRVALMTPGRASSSSREPKGSKNWARAMSIPTTPREDGKKAFGPGTLEEHAKRRREATARSDTEMEVALWIEGVTGETFPGKFWSSLKDGALLCKVMDGIVPGLIKPGLPHTSRGTFPELENLSAFLSACRKVGVAEHSLFDPKDLHEKRDMQAVVRCLHVLGAAVQSTVPEFRGPFLGKRSEALSVVNARGLRKRLGKGPGARGGINTLHKGGAGEHMGPYDVPIEHPDPTATMTPAESPSAKRTSRRRNASGSAAGSGGLHAPVSPRAMAEGLRGALLPAVIMEEEAGMNPTVVRVEREGPRGARVVEDMRGGRRNLAGLFASAGTGTGAGASGGAKESRVLRRAVSVTSGVSSSRRRGRAHLQHEEEDQGEGVVSQIQRFIEQHTHQKWRISGDLHESLRDGWQLALLANALRPGAVRRVHNSIQPAKQVQNIANFLIACRRMGVARALLFDIEDLYEDKSKTRVARTLLALRALAADPDFASARPSSLMGTSLLVTAAALAQAPPPAAARDSR